MKNSRDSSSPVTTFAKGNGLDGPWGIAVGMPYAFILHVISSGMFTCFCVERNKKSCFYVS